MKTPGLCFRHLTALAVLFSIAWMPSTSGAQSTYAGIYEGTFSGDEGDGVFMVMSRAAGTATMLLFVNGGTHERKLSFPINSKTGAFSFKTDEFATQVTGTVNPAQGSYTSDFGTGQGSGARLPFTGEFTASAGYYKGTYSGVVTGSIWAILAPDGRVLVAFDDPYSGGGALGTVSPDGSISWDQTSSPELQINATLNRLTNTVAGTADAGDGEVHFSFKRSEAASAQPIVIDTQPQHRIARTGEMTMLEMVAMVGEDTSIQWQKNGKSIPGANQTTLELPSLTLSDAGVYRVILKNAWGTVTSSLAELTVVDSVSRNVDVFSESPQVSKIIMTARTAGKVTGYSWARVGGGSLAKAGFKVAGNTTSTLTITPNAPLQMEDGGTYVCTVTGPGGAVETSPQNVRVMGTLEPTFAMSMLPDARQNFFYETPLYQEFLTLARAKTWKVKTGSTLPSGLKLTADGKLSGIPKTVSTGLEGFSFTVQGTNRLGTREQTFNLVVQPQGTSVGGIYMALVPRSAHFNGDLGGRLDLTVSATGGLSGKVTLGAVSYPVAGAFNGKLGGLIADLVLKASGAVKHPSILLSLQRAPEVDTIAAQIRENTGDSMAMGESLQLVVQRCPYSKSNPATGHAGRYHLELSSAATQDAPEGPGYAILTLTDTGAVTWGGKLADGATITGTAALDSMKQALLHQMLYTSTGSVQGQVTVDNLSPSAVGSMTWFKQAQLTATTSFPAGFPAVDLPAAGGRYVKTISPTTLLELTSGSPNAQVRFHLGGLEADITQNFTLAASGVATFAASANKISLKIDPATGVITGGMTVPGATAALARKATVSGILVPTGSNTGKVTAHFLLPKPAVTGAGAPLVLSGLMEVTGGAP